MAKRKIIKIEEAKCNGCGLCIPNCPEGAIQIIDGKARLVSDLFCDGLGACLGHCPQGAISAEEREAAPYDEIKVMENIVKQGHNVIAAHLKHLLEHNEKTYLSQAKEYLKNKGIAVDIEQDKQTKNCACPGSKVIDLKVNTQAPNAASPKEIEPQLKNWPIQLMLVPESAPYFKGAELLIAADCVPFSYPSFHERLLKGKILLVGCPKLDDAGYYQQKLTGIIKNNDLKSITCVRMEVPCCFGLVKIIQEALRLSGKDIAFKEIIVSIKGELLK
ncbi:MAG: 4Fe-4S ferredoxin [Candidatus Omnitrophica bacterium]|nr:4Fe-4S ferredoxin [Candidatus Omnitrophota bacterium]